ncbi:MAG: 30S ribosomal protein S16 [Deltaproteobacteria bacterium]|jgi:small subunit ribosomal protein S16|nr:30S ribosomal protein S16 [Deltaproteobacteria bacterium]
MTTKIRLSRAGAKKKPFYRIVVADERHPRDGRISESIGYYDPVSQPKKLKVDLERYDYWTNVGAKPSTTVNKLIKGYKKEQQN